MAQTEPRPTFKAVEMKLLAGWYVLATWPDGREIQIPGFQSKVEIEDWIANQAAEWLLKLSEDSRHV
jgi:hypothetical protein